MQQPTELLPTWPELDRVCQWPNLEQAAAFCDFVSELLARREPLSFAELTGLLTGLGMATGEVSTTQVSGVPAPRSQLQTLARLESHADCLRRLRRAAIGDELQRLADADLTTEHFVWRVVWPLLCRPFVPPLLRQAPVYLADHDRPWDPWSTDTTKPPAFTNAVEDWPSHIALHIVRGDPDPIGSLESALRSWFPQEFDVRTRAAAEYLATARAVNRNLARQGPEARVLFAPQDLGASGLDVGYVLTVTIVLGSGSDTDAPSGLERDSFVPALHAATRHRYRIEPIDATWRLAVGDYPGGVKVSREDAGGPSAGLMLWAALAAYATGDSLRANTFASARLVATGGRIEVKPLKDADSLAAKGRALALLPTEHPPTILLATDEDASPLERSVEEIRGQVNVQHLAPAEDPINRLVIRHYAQ